MKDSDRKAAEMQHALLFDRESDQPVAGKRRVIKVPGGNPNLPVAAEMCAPDARGREFWDDEMPAYVLGILDETVTNGYRIDGEVLELLSDGTELAKTRLRYTVLALRKAGALIKEISFKLE